VVSESTPSGRELEILKALWELGDASVREVHGWLCPNGELAFNTVQTLLRIMDDKGLVKHRTKGRTFIYSANYTRERAAARFLKHVFDGAMDQCVLTLLESQPVSAQELDELERIITKARDRKRARGPKRSPRKGS